MIASPILRGLGLCGAAVVVLALPEPAHAGGNHGEPPPVYEQNYSGPPVIRRIPGLRILFGDPTEDESYPGRNQNQNLKKKNKNNQLDESYYEPEPAPPARPKAVKPPPAKPATATAPANPALPQKTATTAPAKPLADGPLSCEKATELVSGFGFSSVEASSCAGKLYAFNAKRDGKNFAIKLDPASGQLTEVKKLP